MRVNLHTHSIYSDGIETPENIVQFAKEAEFELISLTDHNTFEGYTRFEKACKEHDVKFVKGIEIDCVEPVIGFNREILGYFPNGGEEALDEVLERKQQARYNRVCRALERSEKLFEIDGKLHIEELEQMAIEINGFTGMLSNKMTYDYIQSKKEGLPSYREVKEIKGWDYVWKREACDNNDTLIQLISLISSNGGRAVIPHFGYHFKLNPNTMVRESLKYVGILKRLKDIGLWALEIHPHGYRPAQIKINNMIRYWAKECKLELTSGSDFHGGETSTHPIFNWCGEDINWR
ncbi:MAG: PHP domain-containing protein [Rikenellaceae bacterium]